MNEHAQVAIEVKKAKGSRQRNEKMKHTDKELKDKHRRQKEGT